MTRHKHKTDGVDHQTPSATVSTLMLKVVPGASRSEISGWLGEELKIRIVEAPEKGKANRAVEELLSKVLSLSPQAVKIIKGQTSTRKTLAVTGLSLHEVRQRLERHTNSR